MPRASRVDIAGYHYHVINRASARFAPSELEATRNSVNKGVPYGNIEWRDTMVDRFKLQATMREKGRPKNAPDPFHLNMFYPIIKFKIVFAFLVFTFGMFFLMPLSVYADTTQLQEQIIRLERKLAEIKGQTKTNFINQSSLVEVKSSSRLAKSAGAKFNGKTVKKATQGDVVEDLRYIKGKIWWKIKFSNETVGWLPESKLKRIPSTVLHIDTNSDGVVDSTVRFVGEYSSGYFGFKHVSGDTVVKYFETKEGVARAGYALIQNRI